MTTRKVWIASYESRNFSFEAFGSTEDEARRALEAGIVAHAQTHKTAPDWADEAIADMECRGVELGTCYRDRERINESVRMGILRARAALDRANKARVKVNL